MSALIVKLNEKRETTDGIQLELRGSSTTRTESLSPPKMSENIMDGGPR